MSSRNRGRGNPSQDADEERRLWKEIKGKASEVDGMVTRSNAIGHEIIALESQQASNDPPQSSLDDKLEQLYRANVKLCEQVQHIIEGKSNDMNLIDSLNVLAGLREASVGQEIPQPPQRAATGKLNRVSKKGGGAKGGTAAAPTVKDEDESEEPKAAPSPKIVLNTRLPPSKDKSSRAGSVVSASATQTREASVKLEQDGAESVASSADGAASAATGSKSSASRPSNRLVLTKGEIVFCRHPNTRDSSASGDPPEGEGILCRVTAVIGEGKQRRYEVQDADTSSPDPPPPQRASVSQLIQIPESNKGLVDLGKGRGVLAMYPDTTTFYKAEVSEAWAGVKGSGEAGMVRLNFQDDEVAREVERRFVLTEK